PSSNYTVSMPSFSADITAKALTASATGSDKTYDGNTNASVTVQLSGVVSGDAVSATGTGSFADKNASGSSVATSTVALQSATDYRDIKVINGKLYGSSGSSTTAKGVVSIGTGAPISGSPTNTLLSPNNSDSTSSFAFATLPGGTASIDGNGGPNVMY